MTQALTIPVLPESAPFTSSQRAWLNGFFAALIGSIPSAMDEAPALSTAAVVEPPEATTAAETFPWHEPTLTMVERLKLAEGRPRGRVMMAAMAQLDCGACGYDCMTYAEAIDRGEEKSLTKCAPGGGETAKKLKELVQLTVTAIAPPKPTAMPNAVPVMSPVVAAHTVRPKRNVRFAARLIANNRLNGPESSKDTRHIVFSIKGSELTYEAGDALGVYPENCLLAAQRIIELLGANGAEEVPGRGEHDEVLSLIEALTRHYCIATPTPALLELLSKSARGGDAEALRELAADNAGALEGLGVLDLLECYPSARPDPAQLVGTLPALRPRLYSIASSPRVHPDQVHLTVGVVRYTNSAGRACGGVASTCLAERVRLGERLRVFVQPTAHFRPPPDSATSAIMVGPGTGIAPFRAFLQDRAPGPAFAPDRSGGNWLFFGDQHESSDFLYRDELEALRRNGVLTRLDTAFSRDGADKVYVQDRMREQGAELWRWLERGSHFYICGDAKRMARDVDAALRQIVAQHGAMSPEAADNYVADLARSRRYQRDVY